MNEKILAILLQLVRGLKDSKWATGPDWELTLKTDGHIPMIRSFMAQGNLDNDKWQDPVEAYIDLKLATDDEITYFPEFMLSAQIAIGEIPGKDISYKMQSNTAFTAKDVKDNKKAASAAKEISRLAENHINQVYQDYVESNEEVVRFYKQSSSGENQTGA